MNAAGGFLSRFFAVWALFLLAVSAAFGAEPEGAGVEGADKTASAGIQQELSEGFDWRVKVIGFGVMRELQELPSYANRFLQIGDYEFQSELRPDLSLKFRNIDLSVKPRVRMLWSRWEDAFGKDGSDWDADVFVNEWLARYMIHERFSVSYGRENLQWGPSFLISPSNPFVKDNGKNNPYVEVPGLDYARAVWTVSPKWNVSAVANTDSGEMDFFSHFEKSYAVKVDYIGDRKYFSVIPAYRESDDFQLGYYGGWTVNDALLLHMEGAFMDWDKSRVLIGGSYTLGFGPTISLEYYYNGAGCDVEPYLLCFWPLGERSPDDILLRKNYFMAQLVHTRMLERFNVILRWVCDIDDGSSRSIGIVEYELGDHMKLFTVGNYYTGDIKTEFGLLFEYSMMVGAEYNF